MKLTRAARDSLGALKYQLGEDKMDEVLEEAERIALAEGYKTIGLRPINEAGTIVRKRHGIKAWHER